MNAQVATGLRSRGQKTLKNTLNSSEYMLFSSELLLRHEQLSTHGVVCNLTDAVMNGSMFRNGFRGSSNGQKVYCITLRFTGH